MGFNFQLPQTHAQTILCLILLSTLSACANVPLQQKGTLGSYTGMTTSGGALTKAKLRVDPQPVLAAKTVRILRTSTQIGNASAIQPKDLALVSNAIDRTLCTDLADRFKIVSSDQPADLTVHATVTDIVTTNKTVAASSTVASLGATAAALPVPIPRIPVGLGGLSVEAEALAQDGSQKAAMLWSRGANMLTTPRYSSVGDAYSLSSAFSNDFSRMLVKGKDPFKGMPAIPSMQRMRVSLGGAPKYDACKAFGSAPGITGAVAGQLGLPPNWSDKGAAVRQ
ncbi:DUF3313 domain-containing protein [Rhizobium sp. CB3090]|uniref:DUF3313 domain-containing protein n=1 Tax=Rhizobium sp. CB3090 TaxID=3039156 RepID=UPI0024B144AE|nr:DUF3313 domain-containing protein [Rhizobium sp. CB3090]WFU10331.1 DUF3313 domain-containing protein [Rhizobium sp. CB3090]